jgi:aspartate aminotransferase
LGLTSGDYDRDAFAIRYFADELGLEIAVCVSFAKSMGLYGMEMILVLFFLHLMLTCVECFKPSVSDYVPFRWILPLSQLPLSQAWQE